MEDLFGANLLSKSGEVSTSTLASFKYVLVYFSAAWCKPCSAFTPVLEMFYDSINSFDPEVQIVYVSRDNNPQEFVTNYNKMPWLAVPFENTDLRLRLRERFSANAIPSLYLINEQGVIKKTDCALDVKNKGPLCINDWNLALSN